MITIPKKEESILTNTYLQVKASLEDLRHRRVKKIN